MNKRRAVFVISSIILFFIIGCTAEKPEPVESPKAEIPIPQPLKTEPAKVEPPKVESPISQTPKFEPIQVEVGPRVSFHDKCAGILTNYVDDKGMVNYKTLKRKKLELKKLLDEFAKLDHEEYKRWPKEDKIAFWINAYNIQMLNIIVENYPIESSRMLRILWSPDSIRHIDKNIGGINRQKFIIMDEEFTLAGIDRRFLRGKFDEPRVFLAIFHASLSSSPLRNEPYYGHLLEKQLNDQAKRFLSSPLAFRIDREKQKVYLSAIFQPTWHGKYFTGKYGTDKKFKDHPPATRAVLNFITNYTSKQNISFLETGNYSVEYMKYNWRLNE